MRRLSVLICLLSLPFFSCRHKRSGDSGSPPPIIQKSDALSPTACATFLVDARPSVDPGTLRVSAASASLERIDIEGKLYISKFSAHMNSNEREQGDTLYYRTCHPSTSQCFDGLMLLDDTDVTRPTGSKMAYEYN